ncbi:hypothetical protein [Nocardioides sp. YIM 152588]|uniref:hypothetical protein n=1 Tax=Nocardioides sp. YIM 152588 TaxID=3158259 RepID=UPI0032E3C704
MSVTGRARSFVDRRPRASAALLGAMALFVVVYDAARIARSPVLAGGEAWWPGVVIGTAAGATVLLAGLVVRQRLGHSALDVAAGAVVVLAFAVSHPRHGPEDVAGVGAVAVLVAVDVVLVGLIGSAARWRYAQPARR